ncbi:Uncharacterised protein [Mycobacteroides abscessus subsp. abscessus]|nr:Uncharacterised protein [Mycobacteroides abscessus subsp. abscessus]
MCPSWKLNGAYTPSVPTRSGSCVGVAHPATATSARSASTMARNTAGG